MIWQFPKPSEN
uniref:Uncharacterized protein n=1 Tax=Anguilla anguilla TaxID=7936 RepID=A0A0E9RAD4_ANGAN